MFVNIEAERVRLQLSREALARRLGVAPRTYANYIRGETPIPSDVLMGMARLFRCQTDYLLGLDPRDRG